MNTKLEKSEIIVNTAAQHLAALSALKFVSISQILRQAGVCSTVFSRHKKGVQMMSKAAAVKVIATLCITMNKDTCVERYEAISKWVMPANAGKILKIKQSDLNFWVLVDEAIWGALKMK